MVMSSIAVLTVVVVVVVAQTAGNVVLGAGGEATARAYCSLLLLAVVLGVMTVRRHRVNVHIENQPQVGVPVGAVQADVREKGERGQTSARVLTLRDGCRH